MQEKNYFSVECPSRAIFSEIADKWSMMILSVLESQPRRFNDIKRRLEGVSQKSLTQSLRKLERNGILERTVISSSPVSVQYSLTPLGHSLLGPFKTLYLWIVDNVGEVYEARQLFDARQTD